MKKKIIAAIAAAVIAIAALAGCSEANRVSANLSLEADNFNEVRQLTVINCIKGDTLFQMTGKMSINYVPERSQLEIIVEDENGEYSKHYVGISDNVTYVVEDISAGDVDKYKYTLNFNPNMWIPVGADYVD